MKIKLLLISYLLLLCSVVNAQEKQLFFGLNFAKIDVSSPNKQMIKESNSSERMSIHVGALLSYNITNILSVESGAMFSGKGYVYQNTELIIGSATKVKYNSSAYYIDVPLRLKLHTHNAERITSFITSGIYAGYGLFGKTKRMYDQNTDINRINFGNDMRKMDFGLSNGIGFGTSLIQFGVYYEFGLVNAFINSEGSNHKVIKVSLSLKID